MSALVASSSHQLQCRPPVVGKDNRTIGLPILQSPSPFPRVFFNYSLNAKMNWDWCADTDTSAQTTNLCDQ